MAKISEELEKYKDTKKTIRHYEKLIAEYERKSDELEKDLEKKEQLKCIEKTLGDIDIKDKYLKVLLDRRHNFSPHELKQLYSIIADTDLSKKDFSILADACYILSDDPDSFSRIKKGIGKYDDMLTLLDEVSGVERIHCITDSYRIEFLKGVFKSWYTCLYRSVRYEGVRASDIMDVLPTKEFMEDTRIKAHEMTVAEPGSIAYKPAEDLVYFRVSDVDVAKKYKRTKPGSKIYLGYSEYGYGTTIYTSFTKGEYEEDLEKAKGMRKKKGDSYVGW